MKYYCKICKTEHKIPESSNYLIGKCGKCGTGIWMKIKGKFELFNVYIRAS